MDEHLDADGNLPQKPPREEPPGVQRLWVRVGRTGSSRFLSHLEAMNAWVRALRRARIPLAYSQGFHPHPKLAFNTAAPVGEASIGDWMDLTLTEVLSPAVVVDRLRATLPEGFHAVEAREVPLNAPALMAVSKGATYTVVLPDTDREAIAAKVAELLAAEQIIVQRLGKAKSGSRGKPRKVWRDVDVRPMLRELTLRAEEPLTLDVRLVDHETKPGKIREIVAKLSADPEGVQILKRDTLLVDPAAWGKLAPVETSDDEDVAEDG
jgi:radical SAM-linked protein